MTNEAKPSRLQRWQKFWQTPGFDRTHMAVMLLLWVASALWGWIFVEPTVLQVSQAARDVVALATKLFPLLENLHKLGPRADKALYLHSVMFFVAAPVGLTSAIANWYVHSKREARYKELSVYKEAMQWLLTAGLLALPVFVAYISSLAPYADGRLHRTGHSIALSPITVPVLAPFILGGVWCVFGCFVVTTVDLVHRIMEGEA